jgi:hypothetical protein
MVLVESLLKSKNKIYERKLKAKNLSIFQSSNFPIHQLTAPIVLNAPAEADVNNSQTHTKDGD